MQALPASNILGSSGCRDEVVRSAVGNHAAPRSLQARPLGQGAVRTGQAGKLQQAGLSGCSHQDSDPHVTRQVIMAADAVGVGGAYQQRLSEEDVPGSEGDGLLGLRRRMFESPGW